LAAKGADFMEFFSKFCAQLGAGGKWWIFQQRNGSMTFKKTTYPRGRCGCLDKQPHWQSYRSSRPSTADGCTRVTLQDDTQADWVRKVQYAMSHKQRMKAACELTLAERPQPVFAADNDKFDYALLQSICNISRDIPEETARLAANLITGTDLLEYIDVSAAEVLELRVTQKEALPFPLLDISRFTLPEPFMAQHVATFALIHGTTSISQVA